MEKTIAVIAIMLICLLSGCESTPAPRDEPLDEARIQHAVDTERAKWVAELSESITSRLREADSRIEDIVDNQRAVIEAAREYRQLVLIIIDRLQRIEDQRTKVD